MPKKTLKIVPLIVSWLLFILVIFVVEYPVSLTQASITQFIAFFLPLFLALVFSLNLIIKKFILSGILSLGLVILLLLQGLKTLNFITGGLTILSMYLFFSHFHKQPPPQTAPKPTRPRLKKF